jgi:nicotinamide-nucleotide amidase
MNPTAEILTVGDELLRGEVVDTNATWLAGRLGRLGLSVSRCVTLGDPLEPLAAQVRLAAGRCQVLVLSGGLGPTEDDRTTEAVALAAGQPLEPRPEALQALRERFARAGYELTPNNEKQAHLPRGATLLENDQGTAPGFMAPIGDCLVFCLPGVPRELKAMFDARVVPLLSERMGARPALVRSLNTFGIGESQVDHRLADLLQAVDLEGCRVTLHYRTSFPINRVILVLHPPDDAGDGRGPRVLARLEQELRRRIGRHVFGADETSFSDAVVAALRRAGATVALAESCTGGLAGDLLTRAAGSSEVFQLGVVAYANAFKERLLGVPPEVLERHGAVSRQCVEAMARGVRQLAGATYGVAISGIAGPGGGSQERPVGTVHLALASEAGVRHVQRLFPFDRQRNKSLAAHAALALVLREVEE